MNTPLIRLERGSGLDLERGLATEWLETDGLGGYASSTLFFCPTRRYHGLLVVPLPEGERRYVLLSRLEEVVRADGLEVALSMARYPDVWAPRGDETVASFELAPHPRTLHRAAGLELVREVRMVHGRHAVLCRYELRSGAKAVELGLRPFLPCREADALTALNDELHGEVEETPAGLRTRPYDALPPVDLVPQGPWRFAPDPLWYRDLDLVRERERGYPAREDQFSPGRILLRLELGRPVVVAASADGPVTDPAAAWDAEGERRSRRRTELAAAGRSAADTRLALGADDFLYRRHGRTGVVAGFPWFWEWGRDTFIALPGLTLALGRSEACAEVLSGALEHLQNGLLPNVFGRGRADGHYGSVDASLWFARAVLLYERAGGDHARVLDEYLPALLEIAGAYFDGTGLETKADEGGLIRAGSPERNATWMDAQTPDGPVTPRDGCAVEINALWYSLLKHLEDLLLERGDAAARRTWTARRRLARRSFLERFWLADAGYLADVWRAGEVDARVRPNMVIAAALEHSPLTRAQRQAVVERCEDELLTPVGLRTLSPRDPDYRGVYGGDPVERDGAYHQGTVWPWLLGFHCEAALRAFGPARSVRRDLSALLDGLEPELDRHGLNHVSEVYDGDPPHRPGGTIAQAWSTAELLRARALVDGGGENESGERAR